MPPLMHSRQPATGVSLNEKIAILIRDPIGRIYGPIWPEKCISSGGNVLGEILKLLFNTLSLFSEMVLMSGSASDALNTSVRLKNNG
jgi:hypothetical protein